MSEEKIPIHDSCGNVFADVGLPNAEELLAKAELAVQIIRIVKQKKLTQVAAAEVLGIPQPKVSALLGGSTRGISTGKMIRLLNRLGCDVHIKVSKAKADSEGRVRITSS